MSWAVGYDENWKRHVGYGVPAYCDHPKCHAEIDRGLSYVCGVEPYGQRNGDWRDGCGLYFCEKHGGGYYCPRCTAYKPPYKRIKPEHPTWMRHVLADESWAEWRAENPQEVSQMQAALVVHLVGAN